NTASPALLENVSGLSYTLAANIVKYRNENGPFRNRNQLMKVSRMGAKSFEQAAGFLRIRDGDNPLDASSVHPESYPVVERILQKTDRELSRLIGDERFLRTLAAADFTDDHFGLPTVGDILTELEKPGRDPRGEFKTASFKEGVEDLADLHPGMMLEGTVTNVTNFGAFIDIGVHQDGLVHISQMSDKFVKDPRDVVKTGDLVRVRVVEVDHERRRIALSLRPLGNGSERPEARKDPSGSVNTSKRREKQPASGASQGALAAALAGALRNK
ncbi:MAG: helix-hairpin-helix domain-containing protein, partial [Gammaproteobacteria bacterium]|nr:helix-hairpin-helix domain-containing protein [Gammaproteobacteria bacterium]